MAGEPEKCGVAMTAAKDHHEELKKALDGVEVGGVGVHVASCLVRTRCLVREAQAPAEELKEYRRVCRRMIRLCGQHDGTLDVEGATLLADLLCVSDAFVEEEPVDVASQLRLSCFGILEYACRWISTHDRQGLYAVGWGLHSIVYQAEGILGRVDSEMYLVEQEELKQLADLAVEPPPIPPSRLEQVLAEARRLGEREARLVRSTLDL